MTGLSWDEDEIEFAAQVHGSEAEPYRTRVWLAPGRGGPRLGGSCSCPAAKPCKHMAAVAWAGLEHGGGASDASGQEVLRWAAQLERATEQQQAAPKPRAARVKQLVYVLTLEDSLGSDERRHVVLRPHSANLRRDGSLGAAKRFDMDGSLLRRGRQRVAWIAEDDYLLWFRFQSLRREREDFFQYTAAFPRDPRSIELFDEFVATGRCRALSTDGPPLFAGPRREGTWRWSLAPDGSQSLGLELEGIEAERRDDIVFLPLLPPRYLDSATGECGELGLRVPDAAAVAMLDAPSISARQSADLPAKLAETLERLGVPPPRPLDVEVRAGITPTPVFRISVVPARGDESGAEIDVGALFFDYGSALVPDEGSENESVVVDGERVLRVRRSWVAENTAREQLARLGFSREAVSRSGPLNEFTMPYGGAWVDFFNDGIDELRADGWRVDVTQDVRWNVPTPDAWYLETEGGSGEDWFSLEIGVEIDGERINVLPAVVAAIHSGQLRRDGLHIGDAPVMLRLSEDRMVQVPRDRVESMLDVLVELFGDKPLEDDRLSLPRASAARLVELELDAYVWSKGGKLRELAQALRDHGAQRPTQVPEGLQTELRDYQVTGLGWLQFLRDEGLGGILADDMGLGKTVQALAHLLAERDAGRLDRPSLVVAPRSVLRNWENEARRFTPSLNVAVYHGAGRHKVVEQLEAGQPIDLVVTTYALLQRDPALSAIPWHLVVLDEAQAIKNAKTKVATAARDLIARHRVCLTGTPMENNLGELWSLFTFAMPGLLGSQRSFNQWYRRPIERDGDSGRLEALSRRVAPFVLRRAKAQVLDELPPKTEVVLHAELSRKQRDLYESVRLTMEKRVRKALKERGLAKSQIIVLDALLKLRQVCCHPPLAKLAQANQAGPGAKLALLWELLTELLAEGRRVLLFSQFTSMLSVIEDGLRTRDIDYLSITGRTRKRQQIVDTFQEGQTPVLLISLKAGGTGLNLTAADTVIHYDPWWNPAVERQATDRAHRIGQTQPVTVYRLICEGTVEERMLSLQARKRTLTQGLSRDAEQRAAKGLRLDEADLEALLAPVG